MSVEARRRVVLGIGIPLAALLFLAALILAFSRILLAVPEEVAPWVALLFATNILVGCALAAMIPGTRGFTFLIGLLVATIVVGGIVGVVVGERPVESLIEGEEQVVAEAPEENAPALSDEPVPVEEEAPPGEEPPAGGGGKPAPGAVSITAEGLAFGASEIALPAGPSTIELVNRDQGVPHNVSIYTEQGGGNLFEGELVTGPGSISYDVPALDPGRYFFQCDVHPTTMTGTLTVA